MELHLEVRGSLENEDQCMEMCDGNYGNTELQGLQTLGDALNLSDMRGGGGGLIPCLDNLFTCTNALDRHASPLPTPRGCSPDP